MTPQLLTGALAALLLAACGGAATPTTAPASADPVTAPGASAAASAAPDPSPAASPAVAREALGRGSRVCVRNETRGSLTITGFEGNGHSMLGLITPGETSCQWGNFQRDPFQVIGGIFGSQYFEVHGAVSTGAGGTLLGEFWAFNPWIGSPWLRVDDRAGSFTDHTWSVGDRWTITSHGYTLTTERVDDSSDYKEWVIRVTRP